MTLQTVRERHDCARPSAPECSLDDRLTDASFTTGPVRVRAEVDRCRFAQSAGRSERLEHRVGSRPGRWRPLASGQTTSTATLIACAASASMSARSPVTTVPPGSAIATTRASTAEPVRANRLSSAARRAVDSLTDGSMMHIFKNRWVLASRRGSPSNDSTSTIVGTTGGHSSCALSAPMSDSAVLVRAERRDTPPLSSTSTDQPTRSSDRSRIRRAIASAVAC